MNVRNQGATPPPLMQNGSGQLAITLDGITRLPPRHVAAIKSYLERQTPPDGPPPALPPGLALAPLRGAEAERYLRLFAQIGERWLWWSRLLLTAEKLAAVLDDPATIAFAVVADGRDIGLLEWDVHQRDAPELAFLGLTEVGLGRGLGSVLLQHTLHHLFARPIRAVRVNTCSFDHPAALSFYRKHGFVVVVQAIEIVPDPRLTGTLPETAAPHVPILRT